MTIRTSDNLVRDKVPDIPAAKNLTGAIRTASVLVDTLAAQDSDSLLSDDLLKEIETLLAAHYYTLGDPLYRRRSTLEASGEFFLHDYWEEAARLDQTGFLKKLSEKRKPKAGAHWLGRLPSNQTDYLDRDRET